MKVTFSFLPLLAVAGCGSGGNHGDKVVFVSIHHDVNGAASAASSTFNIWRVNADGTGLRPLTRATMASSGDPQWSPDGSKIVFNSSRKLDGSDDVNKGYASGPTWNIWRVNADGTGLTPLTNATATGADSAFPQWSPDGSKIFFGSSRHADGRDASGIRNLWRVNADGSGLEPLTRGAGWETGSDRPQVHR